MGYYCEYVLYGLCSPFYQRIFICQQRKPDIFRSIRFLHECKSCLRPTYHQCICDCICVQHQSLYLLSGHLFNIREIEKYPLYKILAVTTCPPLLLVDGEVCNDTSCTTNKKLYGDKCIVSYKTGYNLSTTNDVHECTQNGSWSDHDLRKRRMCNRDRLIDC